MLHRSITLGTVLMLAWTLQAQTHPTAQEKEVIEWVVHSLIQQQRYLWSDWSRPEDRRVVLVADRTIPVPTFSDDDYGLSYAVDSLKTKYNDLYGNLRNAGLIELGSWRPAAPTSFCQQDDSYPEVKVVPARTQMQAFKGAPIPDTVALVIRFSTPAFSRDGRAAAVYAEAIGSHADNSERQLITLTRKDARPDEWDAVIQSDRLFPLPEATAQERRISTVDRSVMTAALQWLVEKRGEFDLVGLADFAPSPAAARLTLRESNVSFDIPESTLAQLDRRNAKMLEYDPSIFAIKGVRDLPTGDTRIWSRPSVLVSLPAYDGSDVAVLNLTYRTSSAVPETATYLMVLRRSNDEWTVVSTCVEEGVIVSEARRPSARRVRDVHHDPRAHTDVGELPESRAAIQQNYCSPCVTVRRNKTVQPEDSDFRGHRTGSDETTKRERIPLSRGYRHGPAAVVRSGTGSPWFGERQCSRDGIGSVSHCVGSDQDT